MSSPPLIHASWLQPFVRFVEGWGSDPVAYCVEAGIEPALVIEGDGWITKRQLYRFLDTVADGEGLPELGFLVGNGLRPDAVRGLGESIREAGTLGEAIRIFCGLIRRSTEGNHSWLEEGERGEVWLFNRTENPFRARRHLADHAGLMSLVNLVRLAGGDEWYPARVALQTGPTRGWRRLPGLDHWDITYHQTATGVAFPARWLLRAVRVEGGEGRPPDEVEALLPEGETLAERIRRLAGAVLGVGGMAPSVNLMAELCETSPRSLHRRLRAEGCSYRGLLEEVRYRLARERLAHSDTSIKELAAELGYSGPNNFIRAFQRRTGMSPGAWRGRSVNH